MGREGDAGMARASSNAVAARAGVAIIAAFGFAVFLAAVAIEPQFNDLRYAAMHHGYLGALLVVAGFAGLTVWSAAHRWRRRIAWVLAICGMILIVDDAVQHAIQRWADWPDFRSPLNRLYGATLWKIPAIAEVNRWLDRLLGAFK
jgi:hypothetical protein